jgi:hypothetical protein
VSYNAMPGWTNETAFQHALLGDFKADFSRWCARRMWDKRANSRC